MFKNGTLEEIAQDMKDGVYNFTQDGKCSNCGSCCSNFLPLSKSEIAELHRYVNKHHIKEQNRMMPMAGPTLDFTCPFRSETEKKCLVYEKRPQICKSFQCNKPQKKIEEERELFSELRILVDMREEFFGK